MAKAEQGRLSGRVAVVTAAGQGIGRAVAEHLTAEGAVVHASDINDALLRDLEVASTTVVDASDGSAVRDWISDIAHIDIVVHAAGWVHQGTIVECSPDDWRKSMQITLDSAYLLLSEAVPRIGERGGSVIAIASVASSLRGFPRRAAYCAAKGGVIGLIKACAADYLSQGIRFNAVCPGTVDTPSLRQRIEELVPQLGSHEAALRFFTDRQPAGRFTHVDEVAGLVAMLASDEAAAINGQALCIDGGISI
ncbi:SDR family oxidoreductase [Paracoccus sp. Z330]|uniref:SDR family oxidoreductase n=1 Tax=Paracoccus onchidii TaxID=3017813 RepID=A0ABT4ZAH8_9RHOB|nr:SDR family oxidoreductase [Paracoccus onchidii]MDB6176354.1 SDR family oxidoreductase [Paracoccus onchidii]